MHRNRRVSVVVAGVALLASAGIATANSDTTDPPASTETEGTNPVSTIATRRFDQPRAAGDRPR